MNAPSKILFIDDDPAVLLTVGDRLRLEGYEVTTLYDGNGVLRADAKFPPVDRVVAGDKPADLLKAVAGLLGSAPHAQPSR